MANLDVIRRLSVELEVRGQDQAAAALKRFADAGGDISRAFGPVAETVDKTTKGFASAGDRAEQLERRLITSANATYNLGKALKTLDTPGALDRLGPERFAATLSEALGRVPDIKARAEQMGQEFTRSFNESLRIGVKATDLGASFSALEEQLAKQEEIAKAHAAHIATISQQAIADLTGQNRPSAVSNGATFSGLTDLMRDLEAEEKRQQEQQRLIGQAVADSFWQGFSDRLRIGAKATEGGATFSALDEMMAKEEEIAKARGAHIADLSQRNIATLTGQNQSPATANGATFSALAEQAQQYDRQKRLLAEMLEKADPLGQEMKRLSEAQKAYNTALAEGEITQEQFVKLSEYSSQRIDVLSRNLGKDGLASGLKLSANQFQNLGYQINDVITMASMGASPFQILATQGGQVYQILAGARGGLAGGLAAVKDGFLKLLSPANIAMGALATGAVTAIYGWARFHETLKEIDASLSGLGRTTLATTQQLNAVAEGAADSGGNVNRWQARSGVAALAATGRIDPSVYAEIVKQGQNYARLTGETLPDAQKELAASFANLPDALQKLQDRFNLFSASEQRSIELLWNSGNRIDAVRGTLAKLNPVLDDASHKVGGFAAFWDAATKKAVEYADKAGKVLAEAWAPNLEQQRQHLQNQIEQMGPRPTPGGGIFGNLFGNPADQRTAWDDQRSALQKQIDEIDRELDAFKKKHDDLTREGLASQLSQDIEANIRKNIGTFGELTKQIEDTQAAMRQLDAQIANPSFPDMPEKDRKRALDARRAMIEAAPNLEIYRQYGGKEQFDAVQQAQRQVSMAGMTEFERGLAEIEGRFDDANRALIDSRPPLDELIAKERALTDIRNAETEALRRQTNMATARQFAPEIFQAYDLGKQLKTFSSPEGIAGLHAMGFDDKQIEAVLSRLRTAIQALQTPLEKMLSNYRLEQDSINAVTFQQKAMVEAQKAFNDTLDTYHDKVLAVTAAQIAYNNAIAQSVKQAYEGLRDARDSAALVGMRPAQRAQAEITQEYNRKRLESPPEAKAMLDQAEALKKWQAVEDTLRQTMQNANDNIREQIDNARVSAATYGHTTAEIAAAAAKQDLLNQYMREGIAITPELRKRIEEYGQAAGQAASYSEGIHKAQQTMEDIKGAGQDAFKGLISDLRNGTDAGQAFLNMLNKITDKLIDMMLNSLFDTSGTGGGIWQLLSNPSKFFEVLSGKGAPAAPGNVGPFSAMPNATLPNLSTVPMSSTINQAISGSLVPAFKTAAQSVAGATPDIVKSYIQTAALQRGIDPGVALRVANSEGLRGYNPANMTVDSGGDGGSSFGPFQLHYGGINPSMPRPGLGDEFTRTTGLNASDPSTWQRQVDFALDTAKRDGWRQWMGAQNSGIGRWDGINTDKIDASVQKSSLSIDSFSKTVEDGGQNVGSSLTQTASLVTKDGDGLGNALQQAAQKLTSGGGGGGGLGGLLGNLFGGSGGFGSGNSAGIDFSFWDNADYGIGMHDGGTVGRDVTFMRRVPAGLFNNAPRYHTGLNNDEFRAILQQGERVLTKKQNRQATDVIGGLTSWAQANDNAARGGGSGDNKPIVNVNVHNNHPNADVQTKQNADGSIDVVVDMLQNRLAGEAVRGRGALYKGMTSRADGRALRG